MNYGPFVADFTADTIGSSGDRCPFLYSNKTNIAQSNIFMANYFSNKDGLLIFPNLNGKSYALRLLYTDSGHYLVPVFQMDKAADESYNLLAAEELANINKQVEAMKPLESGGSVFLFTLMLRSSGPHVKLREERLVVEVGGIGTDILLQSLTWHTLNVKSWPSAGVAHSAFTMEL